MKGFADARVMGKISTIHVGEERIRLDVVAGLRDGALATVAVSLVGRAYDKGVEVGDFVLVWGELREGGEVWIDDYGECRVVHRSQVKTAPAKAPQVAQAAQVSRTVQETVSNPAIPVASVTSVVAPDDVSASTPVLSSTPIPASMTSDISGSVKPASMDDKPVEPDGVPLVMTAPSPAEPAAAHAFIPSSRFVPPQPKAKPKTPSPADYLLEHQWKSAPQTLASEDGTASVSKPKPSELPAKTVENSVPSPMAAGIGAEEEFITVAVVQEDIREPDEAPTTASSQEGTGSGRPGDKIDNPVGSLAMRKPPVFLSKPQWATKPTVQPARPIAPPVSPAPVQVPQISQVKEQPVTSAPTSGQNSAPKPAESPVEARPAVKFTSSRKVFRTTMDETDRRAAAVVPEED